MPLPKKSNRVIKRERMKVVVEMLIAGVPTNTIMQQCSGQFECSERAVRNYIYEARHKVLPSWYDWSDQRAHAAEIIAKIERVYARALAKDRLSTALRALHQLAELRGLTAAQQIARDRDTFRQQLEAIRAEHARTQGGRGMPLEQFNMARAVYGMRPLTDSEYTDYCLAQERLGDPVSTAN